MTTNATAFKNGETAFKNARQDTDGSLSVWGGKRS